MKEILKKIVPDAKERVEFKRIVATILKKIKVKDAQVMLGGSAAKDTWLSQNYDLDFFVRFKPGVKNLSDKLEAVLNKKFLGVMRVHGSRDYFQFSLEGYDIEVVPIQKITDAKDAVIITDVSPLHVKWVNDHTKKLKSEIRLAKQFFRAQRLYGAESHIKGFSGYVLEILVVYYGSFEKLLEAATKWKDGLAVDVAKHYPKKDARFHLNRSKHSPLVVVDPVDPQRNALAALSLAQLKLARRVAKKYLKKRDLSFFEHMLFTREKLKKKKYTLVFLEVDPLKGKLDIVGSKILKVFTYLSRALEPFGVADANWDFEGKAVMYFQLETKMLPEFEQRVGPPVSIKHAVRAFKKIHKSTRVENGHVVAKVKYPRCEVVEFVEYLLQKKYVQEKVQKIILC